MDSHSNDSENHHFSYFRRLLAILVAAAAVWKGVGPDRLHWFIGVMIETGERDALKIVKGISRHVAPARTDSAVEGPGIRGQRFAILIRPKSIY
jgi:hypothetical protein